MAIARWNQRARNIDAAVSGEGVARRSVEATEWGGGVKGGRHGKFRVSYRRGKLRRRRTGQCGACATGRTTAALEQAAGRLGTTV